ncbi:MAG: shufflon system plasmid conjugative transfer pilus tip adhesin PilV [Kluyvera sp.]|uniref:shufflon system plasmid conjugative transfer pilus tip adhesin PilV n=1 Tax=Kluyvera sp. TaxID=1538228 RepID=UPI003F3C49B8
MKNIKSQHGFTILETLIVLIVMVAVLSSGAVYMKYNADNNLNHGTAESLQQLTTAAQWYAKDNFDTLINATATEVNIDTLITGKYLNENFSDKNSYQQNYKISISKNTGAQSGKDTLSVLIISEGGDDINIGNLRKITSLAGNSAGYAAQSGIITGNQGSWSQNTSIDYGHLASLSFVSANDVVSAETFLRRNKLDGHPEWNQMNTNLDMNSNNIEFDSGSVVFKHDNYDAMLSANGGAFSQGSDKTTITSDQIKLSNGDSNVSGSAITAQTVKPGLTLINYGEDIYTAADNICNDDSEDTVGKLFVVGHKSDQARYTFMCGKDDGYSKSPRHGRAYYAFGAQGAATSICDTKYWIPGNIGSNSPTDSKESACIQSVSSDLRNAKITYLKFLHTKEVHNFYTKSSGHLNCHHNSVRTQKTNICVITEETLSESTPGAGLPTLNRRNDVQCNASSKNSNIHNIYLVEYQGQTEDSCDRVKFHS